MMLLISTALLLLVAAKANQLICNENTTAIDYYQMGIGAFPDLSNCSSQLTHLDLSNNQITFIPAEIGTFVNLEELILNNNFIQRLPAEIGNLPNLRVLWANNNNLSSLPTNIGQLSNLRVLRISDNRLHQLPAEIGQLYQLEELYAGANPMPHLPPQMGWMSNLITLSIPFSNITEIPAEFGYMHNLQILEAYGNRFQCLPRSVKRLPHLSYGNYFPACRNHTVEAFLTNRTAQRGTCDGFASKINGTALGCFDYAHTTCAMTATEVTVTTRRLSDLSSLGLSCAADAPQVGQTEVVTYPRCDPNSGVATACAGPNADNAVHRREGLVTLYFEDWESCSNFDSDVAPTRRLSADVDAAADVVTTTAAAALPPAPSLHRPQRAVPSLAAFKATVEAARETDMQLRKAELEASLAALNQTGPACNATMTFYYVGYEASVDLSPCLLTLTELVVLGVDFSLVAPQVAKMTNLQTLKIYYTWNTHLPAELGNMRQLTRLEVYGAQLDQWPEVLQRMPQLTRLVLSGASLYSLPPWLGKLRNLVHLDLAYNSIYEIGDEIGQLPKLENLIVPYSYVYSLSPAIARATQLKVIDLRACNSLRLPASLASLNHLEVLDLFSSYFPCVPDAVRVMPIVADAHYFDYTPSCAAVPRPIGYSQTRNDACLWDAYYGFWYKTDCIGAKNKLFVTMYADSACTHQAKRKAVHPLQDFASVGRCTPQYGYNGTMTASYSYCHN